MFLRALLRSFFFSNRLGGHSISYFPLWRAFQAYPEPVALSPVPKCMNENIEALNKRDADRIYRPPLVKNPQIQSATLHNPLPIYLHTYIWPFLAIWPAFFAVYLSEERYNTYIAGSEWTFVWAGSIFSLQALTWLTTKWNVNLDSLFTSVTAKDVLSAKLIKVIPVTNAGSAEICPLLRDHVRALKSH